MQNRINIANGRGSKKMRAGEGVNLLVTQRAIALGFVLGRKTPK